MMSAEDVENIISGNFEYLTGTRHKVRVLMYCKSVIENLQNNHEESEKRVKYEKAFGTLYNSLTNTERSNFQDKLTVMNQLEREYLRRVETEDQEIETENQARLQKVVSGGLVVLVSLLVANVIAYTLRHKRKVR